MATIIAAFSLVAFNGLAQPPAGGAAELPVLPPRIVTKDVPVVRQVMVREKRVVQMCVRVCPPGRRKPYYELRYVEVEDQVAKNVTETKSVTETVAWNTPLYRSATIADLPALSGGSIREVQKALKKVMLDKRMLPTSGGATDEEPDYKNSKAFVKSEWFEFPRGSGREYQLHVMPQIQGATATTNTLLIVVGILKRTSRDEVNVAEASTVEAVPVVNELLSSPPFPYSFK
jgi:hypothetical protein